MKDRYDLTVLDILVISSLTHILFAANDKWWRFAAGVTIVLLVIFDQYRLKKMK